MPKFFGKVGYGETVRTGPGVSEQVITTRTYIGDVLRNTRKLAEADKINGDITTGNSLSIIGDPYAYKHFFAIKYVEWSGILWVVSNVDVEPPRLVLRLGGVYNGPTERPAGNP